MNKTELINAIASSTNMPKGAVANVLDAQEAIATQVLQSHEAVIVLPGLGKLVAIRAAARKARNPLNGETVQLPDRKVVKFRVSATLKAAVK